MEVEGERESKRERARETERQRGLRERDNTDTSQRSIDPIILKGGAERGLACP